MSQPNVERIIGLLATDEAFRREFAADPCATLQTLTDRGMRLTPCEFHALLAMNVAELARFAESIDPRIHRCDLKEGNRST